MKCGECIRGLLNGKVCETCEGTGLLPEVAPLKPGKKK